MRALRPERPPQVVEPGPAHRAASHYLYCLHGGGVQQEVALHTDLVADASHGKGGARALFPCAVSPRLRRPGFAPAPLPGSGCLPAPCHRAGSPECWGWALRLQRRGHPFFAPLYVFLLALAIVAPEAGSGKLPWACTLYRPVMSELGSTSCRIDPYDGGTPRWRPGHGLRRDSKNSRSSAHSGALSSRSGRRSLVRRSDSRRRQRAIRAWSPDRSTSGTGQPRNSAGLVY